ncbi:GNAT family N-acetyltransferase [Agromyces aurantiacus]|uniref:GNAT family N-acetyltransferase n=1 Tax=Agromyces aurantiacus TaxID=165814 RepID=A0ABV9R8I6_9MICO|nr:GNAT family N-acetyltransferase [Agromyces aurantiacus]MBM7504280.1 L-amino acid N-acyltransferase YncA [Agromyces aurantiacus]
MSETVVRPIRDEDWPAVFAIVDEVVREGETYAYPLELDSAGARELWVESPPGLTVVAERGGRIVGTAKMGPNRPGRGDHIGTASFMVASDARGAGVGRVLGQWVVDWHRRAGFEGIQFNAVVASNDPAVRLWRSLGFEVVGTVPGAFRSKRHGRVGLHVMFLAL